MSVVIRAQSLTHRFEDGGGAEDVSLELAAGERVAVIGPNGSGKTTLLGMLTGRLTPRRGSVEVCGMRPGPPTMAAMAKRVGVVSAQPPGGFSYSVEEVVLMGRAPHLSGFRLESEADLEVASAAMESMGVLTMAHRAVDSLSSGERQRVWLARALAQEPELLLLDEPGAFLDLRHAVEMHELLARRSEEAGTAVLCVLHDLNLAALFFDRILLMSEGKLVADGPAPEVLQAERIASAFGSDVEVGVHGGRPFVLPVRQQGS